MNYLEKLRTSAKETGSIACMGLDPVLGAMPEKYAKGGIKAVPYYFEEIFAEMKRQKVVPSAYKLNHGFFLKHDSRYRLCILIND